MGTVVKTDDCRAIEQNDEYTVVEKLRWHGISGSTWILYLREAPPQQVLAQFGEYAQNCSSLRDGLTQLTSTIGAGSIQLSPDYELRVSAPDLIEEPESYKQRRCSYRRTPKTSEDHPEQQLYPVEGNTPALQTTFRWVTPIAGDAADYVVVPEKGRTMLLSLSPDPSLTEVSPHRVPGANVGLRQSVPSLDRYREYLHETMLRPPLPSEEYLKCRYRWENLNSLEPGLLDRATGVTRFSFLDRLRDSLSLTGISQHDYGFCDHCERVAAFPERVTWGWGIAVGGRLIARIPGVGGSHETCELCRDTNLPSSHLHQYKTAFGTGSIDVDLAGIDARNDDLSFPEPPTGSDPDPEPVVATETDYDHWPHEAERTTGLTHAEKTTIFDGT